MADPRYGAVYRANHKRVRAQRGDAAAHPCETGCGRQAREWAWLHDEDPADPAKYIPLCNRCHSHYDRRGELIAVTTNPPRVPLPTYVASPVKTAVERYAGEHGVSTSEAAGLLLREALANHHGCFLCLSRKEKT